MTAVKLNLLSHMTGDKKHFTKDAKKLEKKTPKNQFMGSGSKFPAAYKGVHESLLSEMMGGGMGALSDNSNAATAFYQNNPAKKDYEEDAEQSSNKSANKIDLARQLFQAIINRPDTTRKSMIQQFIEQIGVTHSTAVSYYERLAKEAGITGKGDGAQDLGSGNGMEADTPPTSEPVEELPADTDIDLDDEIEDDGDKNRAGVIRTIDNAHLIYKRQSEDGKFEELWQYNTHGKIGNELDIRRDILAGTDIPPKQTRSPDGSQEYTLTTLGNAQFVHIKGLDN